MPESDLPTEMDDGMSFVNERPASGFNRLLNVFGVGLFTVLLVLGLAQVANRFIFAPMLGVSVAWTGEAARFVLIYMALVGAVVASRDRDHVRIEFLIDRLPTSAKPLVQSVLNLISIAFLVAAAWGGFLAMKSVQGVPPGAVPFITLDYVYAIIPLGLAAMALYECKATVGLLARYVGVTGERDDGGMIGVAGDGDE